MKKIFVLMLFVVLAFPAVTMAQSWTATLIEGACAVSCPTDTVSTLSNKVTLHAISDDLAYAVATAHQSGNKVYASTSGDTKLYSRSSDPTDIDTFAPTASDTAQFSTDSAWKSL